MTPSQHDRGPGDRWPDSPDPAHCSDRLEKGNKIRMRIAANIFFLFHQPVDSLLSDTTDNETARLLEKRGNKRNYISGGKTLDK